MNALLVIDMQYAWLNDGTHRHDKVGVIARINQAAQATRERGGQVIFIRHCVDEVPVGSHGWQVDPALRVDAGDQLVDKTACDSFVDTDLQARLEAAGTRIVLVCGMATEFCVDTTLRAALSRGFDVVALADAHTSGDRPHLTSRQIIEHHNWTWENIAAPAGRTIRVRSVAQMLDE